jgi:hypothetical protein
MALLPLAFVLSSCATVTGPQITSEEETQAQDALKAEAADLSKSAGAKNR